MHDSGYMDDAALALRLLVVLVLAAALVGKLSGPVAVREFRVMLRSLGLRGGWVSWAQGGVIAAEAIVVVLGPWPRTGPAAMVVATGLFAVLTGGVAFAVRRRVTASCRCFGGGGGQLRRLHVVRNAVLTLVSAVAATASAMAPGHRVGLPAVVLCVVVAGVVTTVVVRIEDIVALFADPPPPGSARRVGAAGSARPSPRPVGPSSAAPVGQDQ